MRRGKVRVMVAELRDLFFQSGLTPKEIHRAHGPDERTIKDLLKGNRPVRISSVAQFVRTLGETNIYRYVVPEDLFALEAVPGHVPVLVQPIEIVREARDRNGFAHVGWCIAAIRVDTSAVGILPVPHRQHRIRQLDCQPYP